MRIHFAIATLFLTSIPTQKNPYIPRMGNAETDETGFWQFCHYATGIFPELFATSPGERGQGKYHPRPLYSIAAISCAGLLIHLKTGLLKVKCTPIHSKSATGTMMCA